MKEEASGRCDICYINEHDLFEHPGAPLRDLMLWVRGSAVDEAVEFAHTHVDTAYLALLFDDLPTAMLAREKFIEQGSFWVPVCVAEDDGRFSIVIWDELGK